MANATTQANTSDAANAVVDVDATPAQDALPNTAVETEVQETTEGTQPEVKPEGDQPDGEGEKFDREQTIAFLIINDKKRVKAELEKLSNEELEKMHEGDIALIKERMAISSPVQTEEKITEARKLLEEAKANKRLAIVLECQESEAEAEYNKARIRLAQLHMRTLEREQGTHGDAKFQIKGHGLALESNVGGHTALGISLVSGEGAQQRRSGIGLYLRADHKEEAIVNAGKALN